MGFVVAADVLSYRISNLVKGNRYFVSIRARNDAQTAPDQQDGGFGAWAPQNNAVALALSSRPENFTAHPGTALQLVLKWNVPMDTGDGKNQNEKIVLSYRVDIFNG